MTSTLCTGVRFRIDNLIKILKYIGVNCTISNKHHPSKWIQDCFHYESYTNSM